MNNNKLKELKRVNNEGSLAKFTGGKNLGYQAPQGSSASLFLYNPAYDLSNDITSTRNGNIHAGVGALGSAVANATQINKEITPQSPTVIQSAYNTGYNNALVNPNTWDNITKTYNPTKTIPIRNEVNWHNGIDLIKTNDQLNIPEVDLTGVENAAKEAGEASAKKVGNNVLSTAGKALSWLNIAQGAMQAGQNISNYATDYLHANDISNMMGTSTEAKNGVQYQRKTGVDTGDVMKYTHQLNVNSGIGLASGLASVGSGVGSLALGSALGSWAGPLGMAAGALLGGGLGFLFGGNRHAKVRRAINDAQTGAYMDAQQAESTAGSQGLRSEFYQGADKGFDAKRKKNLKPGDVAIVRTLNGIEPGYVGGLTQGGEGVYNIETGEGSINPGNNRKDNIPTGVSVNDPNPQQTWNNTVVFGNNKNPLTGKTFKEEAAPWLKILERGGDSKTDKVNQENAKSKLNNLAMIQRQTRTGNRIGRFDGGLNPMYSFMSGLPYAIGETVASNRETPYAQNSYVEDPTSNKAIGLLGRLRYDPSYAHNQLIRANRQGMYNANQAASISGGQRKALNNQLTSDLASQRIALENTRQTENNKLSAIYADALQKYGAAAAARAQQALATQQENYRQAVGAKQRWQAQARKNYYTIGRQGILDWNTWDNANQMIRMYLDRNKIDRDKLNADIDARKEERQAAIDAALEQRRAEETANKNKPVYSPMQTYSQYVGQQQQPVYPVMDPTTGMWRWS